MFRAFREWRRSPAGPSRPCQRPEQLTRPKPSGASFARTTARWWTWRRTLRPQSRNAGSEAPPSSVRVGAAATGAPTGCAGPVDPQGERAAGGAVEGKWPERRRRQIVGVAFCLFGGLTTEIKAAPMQPPATARTPPAAPVETRVRPARRCIRAGRGACSLLTAGCRTTTLLSRWFGPEQFADAGIGTDEAVSWNRTWN